MLPQKQILVVEDNPLNRELLTEILSDEYAVLEAKNGQEALKILKQRKDDIALILLDLAMPVMDGYTFLDQVKQDEALSVIPVIVTTQSNSEADEVSALTHGATDFVPKPYHPQVILHRVASIINLRETAAMVNQFQYDRLTGLYSKEFFYRKVRERLDANPEREYTIVFSDIENFKLYNDTFGREAGDRLLRESAATMRRLVGEDVICGRYGADCFLCLQERERERADRARVFGKACAEIPAKMGNVSIKWGIYEIVDRTLPVEHMCDRALLAADSIKGQYNTHYAIYDDELRSKLLRKQAITESVETALAEGQFVVYLQPKYSLKDDELAGAEALVRWNHPELGFLPPSEFIPVFERNGFITRLDQYVWEQICALLQSWRERGYPSIPVSVNVSRADVYRADLPDILLGLVRRYGVEPAQLHLEITESAYAENPDQIIRTVEQLRTLGFIIEMDDFGSGYSSLNMLGQIKVDALKLDMKFIQSATAKLGDQGILLFIVGLARWMNLSVVVEGVETREQLERLREIGCDYVQGYYFAKPMPSEEFSKRLRAYAPKQSSLQPNRPENENTTQSLLVVDEAAGYRALAARAFENRYQVLEAADVQSALAHFTEDGHAPIAAVLLSMTLPRQGAASFLAAIRQDPSTWRIPVLATMPHDEVIEERALELDADDFIRKPHTERGLRKRMAKLLELMMYHRRERALKDEACRDYLTGLLNRRGFHAAINALRQDELPLAACIFDLDDLKRVNDTYGHEAGDRMLRAFGEHLRRHTGAGDILCRYGGDEFVVLVKRAHSIETIGRIGQDICAAFRAYQMPDGHGASCSCGVALCGAEEKPSEKLIERADRALYRAKREQKGGCCLYEQ